MLTIEFTDEEHAAVTAAARSNDLPRQISRDYRGRRR